MQLYSTALVTFHKLRNAFFEGDIDRSTRKVRSEHRSRCRRRLATSALLSCRASRRAAYAPGGTGKRAPSETTLDSIGPTCLPVGCNGSGPAYSDRFLIDFFGSLSCDGLRCTQKRNKIHIALCEGFSARATVALSSFRLQIVDAIPASGRTSQSGCRAPASPQPNYCRPAP